MTDTATDIEHGPPLSPTESGGGKRWQRGQKWPTWAPTVLAGLALALGLLLWIRGRPVDEPPIKAQRDVPFMDGARIRYSSDFAKRNDLRFGAPESSTISPLVHVTGTVTFDPNLVAAIGARIEGRVRSVRHIEGDQIKPGEVLAEIESAELGQAQATLISARAQATAATVNEKRERELADNKISSYRDAELASATAAAARAELLAAEGRVRAMGGTPGGEPGILFLQSPIAGKVVERNLSRGQFVEPTLTAFRVADLRRVWIQLAVFEREVAMIEQGDPVDVIVPNAAAPVLKGTVAYVGDEIDLETRTAAMRVVVEQPETPLRPGQSVSARIHSSATNSSALVIPRDAVTRVDGKPTVFVAVGELAVEPRSIELGREDASRVEVSKGLSAEDRIVVSGVFALKSEIFR